jgi:hypothetical protein
MTANWLDDDPPARPRRRWTAPWIVAACAALPLILAAAIYSWNDTRALFWLKGGGAAAISPEAIKKQPLLGAASLAANDPALRFSETQVGQVVFSTVSDTCRRHLFDNRTGRSYWVDNIPCGRTAEPVTEDEPPHRLNALKKSFAR